MWNLCVIHDTVTVLLKEIYVQMNANVSIARIKIKVRLLEDIRDRLRGALAANVRIVNVWRITANVFRKDKDAGTIANARTV